MNVLSLFDGISCGRVALERAGLSVSAYYASEIDKYAMKISEANYPEIIQLGDVQDFEKWELDWSSIDLVLAGFPCQSWSIAGKQLGDRDPRGGLFWTMLDIAKKVLDNPNAKFLFENVRMKKDFEEYITQHTQKALGTVHKILINSALVSAQNRQRFYWTNFETTQPEDLGIILADIIEEGAVDREKSYCVDANYAKGSNLKNYFEKGRRQIVFKPATMLPDKSHTDGGQVATASEIKGYDLMKRVYGLGGKSPTLNACTGGNREPKIAIAADGESVMYRKLTPLECERLQTLPDNYTNHVSNTQRYKAIGNGWTVDVIVHILREGFKKL